MTKGTKTTLMVLGVGAIGYYLYTKGKLPFLKPKDKPMGATTSFSGNETFYNLTAAPPTTPKVKYIAGGYVQPSLQHPNGQTWISYGGSGASGYWQDGYVAPGTIITNPSF